MWCYLNDINMVVFAGYQPGDDPGRSADNIYEPEEFLLDCLLSSRPTIPQLFSELGSQHFSKSSETIRLFD
jgi:hypothetical protein